jgi:hypothetical protein
MANFIGIYDNLLSKNDCLNTINYFENNPHKLAGAFDQDGETVVDKTRKDSSDVVCLFSDQNDITNSILNGLINGIEKYRQEYPDVDKICSWEPYPSFNIQRYLPGQGYHDPHCEMDNKFSPRVLAWMYYLNDVTDCGQTRFTSHGIDVIPKEGRLVIWPAYFTHVHHGIKSPTQIKYIATGWHIFV